MQQKSTWDRPTWKFGTQSESLKKSQAIFNDADALFRFFMNRQREDIAKGRENSINNSKTLPPDVQEACVIFNVDPPFNRKKLKTKYLSLMKKHHPDRNKGRKSAEEHMKKINVAYQILQEYCDT